MAMNLRVQQKVENFHLQKTGASQLDPESKMVLSTSAMQ
jgi:hypothetical protein